MAVAEPRHMMNEMVVVVVDAVGLGRERGRRGSKEGANELHAAQRLLWVTACAVECNDSLVVVDILTLI